MIMTPKSTLTGPSNGLHLHISLNKLERVLAEQFLAGLLKYMSSLCALEMANYDAYVRFISDAAET